MRNKFSSLLVISFATISSMVTTNVIASWADEELSRMSLDQKIGQTMMVAVASEDPLELVDEVKNLIRKQSIGGLIFMGGKALRQHALVKEYRVSSPQPLLISQDAEWGFSMRLFGDVVQFPKNMTLGAIPEEQHELLFKMGREIGRHSRLLGIDMNLAPIVDVNNNSQNPGIHMRSFGEVAEEVAKKAELIMKGMQSEGMLTTAKHFPGKGDTTVDAHFDLPIINHDLDRLNRVELPPFKHLIDNGVDAVMSAHTHIPYIDSTPNISCTLSSKAMTKLLKEELGFKGLVITDALTMGGITKHFSIPEASVKSLQAGNHILLYAYASSDVTERLELVQKFVPESTEAVKKALHAGELTIEQIDAAALAVLKLKEKIKDRPLEELNSLEQINTSEALELKKNLYRCALTLVKNENKLLPIVTESHNRTLLVTLNEAFSPSIFAHLLNETGIKAVSHKIDSSTPDTELLLKDCTNYDTVVLAVYNFTLFLREEQKRKNLEGMQKLTQDLIKNGKRVIAVLFGTPYGLPYFKDADAVFLSYEEDPDVEMLSADMILGKVSPIGKLPVTPCAEFPRGLGLFY